MLTEILAWMNETSVRSRQDRDAYIDVMLFIDHEHLKLCAAERERQSKK